ncbi:MAG: AlkZ family DNA glycosylase [Anaerolineae bacterium]|nr:AlkZ family DNA glycosylase [Anaerolineae bacterium]
MAPATIARQRLNQQRLSETEFTRPEEVVGWLGAVQAQDFYGALWSLGMRMQQATDDPVEQAFSEGRIIRTHLMRPTWHFVTPEDIRWIIALTAPRVNAISAFRYRQLELDESTLERSSDVIANVLQGGSQLTRREIGAALEDAGISAEGQRLPYILMRAELDMVACSGPRRGKQFTYMLMDERAPDGKKIYEQDEALVRLLLRYLTGHGLATLDDFAWWSGLTLTDIKAGVDMAAGQLNHAEIDGQTYWFTGDVEAVAGSSARAFLLPTFDEFLVGFSSFGKASKGGPDQTIDPVFSAPLMIDGQIVGSWRRTLKKQEVTVETASFDPLTDAERGAVSAAADRYGAFVGMPVNCLFDR